MVHAKGQGVTALDALIANTQRNAVPKAGDVKKEPNLI
jgi:hypothetical protein